MDELDEFQSGIHEVGDVYGKTIREPLNKWMCS